MSVANNSNETIARMGSKMRAYRDKLKAAEEKAAALESAKADIEKQLDEFKARANTADEKDKRIVALESEIREGKHRSAFSRVARDAGVSAEAIDDAYTLSGYEPEGEPDDAKIKEAIEAQRESRAYLFAKANQGPGPGASRGGKQESPSGFPYSDEQMKDPAFVMANYDAIAKATKERLASQ